ncbi:MAG TPA: HNH endonuclease [Acidimicrobiales bacterium]|nr:HNH endonuclease [Acidimicrobiales bacterium]
MLARWRAEHGDWCPGYGRAPHPATDLSLDHVVSRSEGGRSEPGNAGVLCIGCNVRKGGRNRRRRG